MVQVSESVGIAQKGSMNAVLGSGIASMSEASMLFQPRMLEPSKPRPSSKVSSDNSAMGQLKCCQVPKVSTNLISTILAPLFFASSNTLLGVLMVQLSLYVNAAAERLFRSGNQLKSNSLLAGFLGADADGVFNRADENFSVADLAGPGRLDDGIHRRLHICVREHDFEFQLG